MGKIEQIDMISRLLESDDEFFNFVVGFMGVDPDTQLKLMDEVRKHELYSRACEVVKEKGPRYHDSEEWQEIESEWRKRYNDWVRWFNEDGSYCTPDGHLFDKNNNCLAEPGTDADFDRYAVEVMNGEGYYDSNGKFHRYGNGQDE